MWRGAAPRCFTGPILIRSRARGGVEPYPRQRGDHVLLDDGGFRQPRADVCANKLRRRATPSVKLRVVLLTGLSWFVGFVGLPGPAVASWCRAEET